MTEKDPQARSPARQALPRSAWLLAAGFTVGCVGGFWVVGYTRTGVAFAHQLWKWQTFVAGLFAILAAYIAARPVYRSLDEMKRQSAFQLYQVHT